MSEKEGVRSRERAIIIVCPHTYRRVSPTQTRMIRGEEVASYPLAEEEEGIALFGEFFFFVLTDVDDEKWCFYLV